MLKIVLDRVAFSTSLSPGNSRSELSRLLLLAALQEKSAMVFTTEGVNVFCRSYADGDSEYRFHRFLSSGQGFTVQGTKYPEAIEHVFLPWMP